MDNVEKEFAELMGHDEDSAKWCQLRYSHEWEIYKAGYHAALVKATSLLHKISEVKA
jgi:hypothetical protein